MKLINVVIAEIPTDTGGTAIIRMAPKNGQFTVAGMTLLTDPATVAYWQPQLDAPMALDNPVDTPDETGLEDDTPDEPVTDEPVDE